MPKSTIRFSAQNWSSNKTDDVRALAAAREILAGVPEGRVISNNPGAMLIEASPLRHADVEALRRRLERALPGWSIYPETSYRLE